MAQRSATVPQSISQPELFEAPQLVARPIERFSKRGMSYWRTVLCRDGYEAKSAIPQESAGNSGDIAADYDLGWLRARSVQMPFSPRRTVRIADLFSGCGAMSAGVREACRALEFDMQSVLAVETDEAKLEIYRSNFPETIAIASPIEQIIDGELGAPLTPSERELKRKVGKLDILLGGPPCQGHSDLNNFTRRSDPRNQLILRFARSIEIFRPDTVVIENVQGIRHDKGKALGFVEHHLRHLGYNVEQSLVDCSLLGVPQRRRRFFLVASLTAISDMTSVVKRHAVSERSVQWACEDLLETTSSSVFDTSAVHSKVNKERIDFLFRNNLFDLPNEQRPDCHRLKDHAYNAVYGRMRWDEPAPTITTGFGSTGQGRFVHPLRARSITPHEAARLQSIPDHFSFGSTARTQLQKMIGNAVPPKVIYVLALELLR